MQRGERLRASAARINFITNGIGIAVLEDGDDVTTMVARRLSTPATGIRDSRLLTQRITIAGDSSTRRVL